MPAELSYSKLFFNDGARLTAIKEAVEDYEIEADGLIRTLADYCHIYGNKIDFVGLIEMSGRSPALVIFLPKGYRLSEKVFYSADEKPEPELVSATKLTLDCLGRYFSECESTVDGWLDSRIERNESQECARLDSAVWLINDWRAYGLFQDSFTRYRGGNPTEKVDWKRTLKKQRPLWTEFGPYYQRCQVRERLSSQLGIIAQAHRWCVYQAFRLAGWLTQDAAAMEIELLSDGHAGWVDQSTFRIWAQALTSQLDLEFSDRRIELLRRLKTFLEGRSPAAGTRVAGMPKFERVWEAMCSAALGNEYEKSFEAIMPQPAYLGSDGNTLTKNQRQIPDIIYEGNNSTYYVADAKYYDVMSSLPGWGDIGKQFLYARCLKEVVDKNAAVHNFFLFPAPANPGGIKLPVEVVVKARDEIISDLSKLMCAYFDVEVIMEAYARRYDSRGVAKFRGNLDAMIVDQTEATLDRGELLTMPDALGA